MSKRFADADEDPRSVKRSKTNAPPQNIVPPTDIWSARHLQDLLGFSQDAVNQMQNGDLSRIGVHRVSLTLLQASSHSRVSWSSFSILMIPIAQPRSTF